jgi:cytochrome c biogenesis protein CcdA
MGLDIRWPIGLMFSLIGVLLIGYGAANSADSVRVGVNINIIWGVLLLIFGVLMLVGAVRGRKTPPPS